MANIGRVSLVSAVVASGASVTGCTTDKNAVAAHKKEIIRFQKTCRSVISDLVGVDNYDRFCTAALAEFDGFASEIPELKGVNNKRNFFGSGPWMLSNYRVLRGEFQLEKAEALEKLRRITHYKTQKKFENPPFILRFIFKTVANSGLVRKLFLLGFRHDTVEKYRWKSTFPESDAYIAVDYTRCGLTDWFRDMGVPEIAPIACEGDFIQFAGVKGLRFERTRTLANGDSVCDMRFIKAAG